MTSFVESDRTYSMNEKIISATADQKQFGKLWQILLVLMIILSVFGVAHWFMYLTVTRSFSERASDLVLLQVLYFIGLFLMPVGFLVSRRVDHKFRFLTWAGYIWMGFFTIHFLFSLIEFTISAFLQHPYSYWVIVASFFTSLWALYKGIKFPETRVHRIQGPSEIKKFKIAQISDLHIGMLQLNEHWLEKVVATINREKPDIIAITGDLAEGHFSQISEMLQPLKKLEATLGVFYITGNHEYIHPGDWELCLKNLSITALHNENRVLNYNGHQILIAGVPDKMVSRFRKELISKPDVALSTTDQVIYKILLAHQPASIFDIQSESCDLMLTGHTHGGQIFPFHFAVKLQQPMVSGFKKFKNTLVFNHQGTGFWGPPMRWFSRSEIVLLEIN
jgi:predicted MPP superfamily phosphohydrolase